jgi:predicted nucleic-acid-binding protein
MIAVDTDILIRILTKDDPVQAKRAARLIEDNNIFIAKTVILESEWVLRHAYAIDRNTIQRAFQKLFGLPNVYAEDLKGLFRAIRWYEAGLDFADALHLASGLKAETFATFDTMMAQKASKLTSIKFIRP